MSDNRTHIEIVRDTLYGSPLIWFSQPGSGDKVRHVTAAFLDPLDAYHYALDNPSTFVHFPNGDQLGSDFATKDRPLQSFIDKLTPRS